MFEGEPRRVIENLGFSHGNGKYAKVLRIDGKDVVVTSYSPSGPWQRHRAMVIRRGPVIGQT